MASFLMNCPQCGVMIPKGGPCEDCHWSDQGEADEQLDQETAREFARRQKLHFRNYAVFMVLMFATGLIGLLTAFMWVRVIYFGDVVAFVLIGFLTVLTGVLSVLLAFARRLFPVELNCPSCKLRLDELGTRGDHCPSCNARLR